ncbi:hypothetical protein R3P38DRAFT_3298545 [Favolaschia claudopus]|uniref:Uncharacterized protein n=1 Tax=Favolaschia claudopus TaxID=2862362 RepID=A0AAV9Z3A3_9AGAR
MSSAPMDDDSPAKSCDTITIQGSTTAGETAMLRETTTEKIEAGEETVQSVGYKGKALRSWAQLPPEPTLPLPATWDVHHNPENRTRYVPWAEYVIYVAARNTKEVETLMCVCPTWGIARTYPFSPFLLLSLSLFPKILLTNDHLLYAQWNNTKSGTTQFDTSTPTAPTPPTTPPSTPPVPVSSTNTTSSTAHSTTTSSSGASARPTPTPTPYHHFRTILTTSCLPCRINSPHTNTGLGAAKRTLSLPSPSSLSSLSSPLTSSSSSRSRLPLTITHVCREHTYSASRAARSCGVCFVDGELGRRARGEAVRVAREEVARAEAQAGVGFGGFGLGRWGAGGGMYEMGRAAGAGEEARKQAAAYLEKAKAAVEQARARLQRAEEDAYGRGGHAGGGGTLLMGDAGVADNEDEGAFPGTPATCRNCRAEWLWRYAVLDAGLAKDVPAISGGLSIAPGTVFLSFAEKERSDADKGRKGDDGAGEALMKSLGARAGVMGYFWPEDAIVKALVSAYVELGEGTVEGVLAAAKERGWLRTHTRWGELMKQALASKRWGDAAAGGGAGSGGGSGGGGRPGEGVLVPKGRRARSASPESVDGMREVRYANNEANKAAYARAGYVTTTSEDLDADLQAELDLELLEDEDEDDSELDEDELLLEEEEEDEFAAALDMGVKEMALTDWARARVLDGAGGLGLAEADPYVRAVHPVSWSVSPDASPPHSSSSASASASAVVPAAISTNAAAEATTDSTRHPGPPTLPPPTYLLAENSNNAYMRQMRSVLLPVFSNVVRRLVVECALDLAELTAGGDKPLPPRKLLDPAMRAARMTIAEVVQQLREEEGVWFDGMDWSAKRVNALEDERRHKEEGSGSEGSSSLGTSPRTSDSDTSPVLSTSTLGTTPSPPPGEKDLKGGAVQEAGVSTKKNKNKKTIPVSPVMDPPRLIRPIPHVPETIEHLPHYSMEALRVIWREACAPLYHCRCSVCERAMVVQAAAKGEKGGHATKTIAPAAARAATPGPPRSSEKHAKDNAAPGDGPYVMPIPAEEETTAGAESVVQLVDPDSYNPEYDVDSEGDFEGIEGLTAQERYWLQVERDEGVGAWEREMEMAKEMREGKWGESGGGMGGYDHDDMSFSVDGEEYEYEEEEREEADGMRRDGKPFLLNPAPATWIAPKMTGRKRSVDELEGADDTEQQNRHRSSRGGTPPKRARTVEPFPRNGGKRGSEELDVDELEGVDTASVGSAPKRARVEAIESPPDSSTPGTTAASEDSGVSVVAGDGAVAAA